jgi:hypothetical protein
MEIAPMCKRHCLLLPVFVLQVLAEGALSDCRGCCWCPTCLQVWIILELCTGGTLLDAALAGRFKIAAAAQQAGGGGKMEMVRQCCCAGRCPAITPTTPGLACRSAVHGVDRGCLGLEAFNP